MRFVETIYFCFRTSLICFLYEYIIFSFLYYITVMEIYIAEPDRDLFH